MAITASLLHWVGPLLAAAAAAILILAARALPSQPTWPRARTAPDPKLPVIPGLERGKPSPEAAVVSKSGQGSQGADKRRLVM